MTPDELRALADEATPGPWRAVDDRIMAMGPPDDDEAGAYIFGSLALYDATGEGIRNACLIALAPDLARLCAEYAGAFAQIEKLHHKDFDLAPQIASRALAKLSELKSVT